MQTLICPLCRQTTPLPCGLVSKLGTNHVVQALIEELPEEVQGCTVCKSAGKEAGVYCGDCCDYLCKGCSQKHSAWEKFSRHDVYSMEDVAAGKVEVKKIVKCGKHKERDGEFFCQDCHCYACVVCRVHDHLGHNIVENEEYERSRKEKVINLLGRVDQAKESLKNFKEVSTKQQDRAVKAMQQTFHEIEAARKSTVQKINERCKQLSDQCREHHARISKKQKSMDDQTVMLSARIESAAELVGKGVKAKLQGDALVAHNTFCEELETLVGGCRVQTDYPKISDMTKSVAGYRFTQRPASSSSLCSCQLGTLSARAEWMVGDNVGLLNSQGNRKSSLAVSPGGEVFVGKSQGGIEVYTAGVFRQKTVLAGEKVNALEILSDGKLLVCNEANRLELFSPQGEKLDVKFRSDDGSNVGDIAVDSDNRIYVSYIRQNKVQVFAPTGGDAIKEILCNNLEPVNLLPLQSNRILVHNFKTVIVVNEEGAVESSMSSNNVRGSMMYPALCRDGFVAIARVKHAQGLVSVDQYTNQLRHTRKVFSDVKIPGALDNGPLSFRALPNGDFVMSSSQRLFLFYKTLGDV